jgi:hypothetical protein
MPIIAPKSGLYMNKYYTKRVFADSRENGRSGKAGFKRIDAPQRQPIRIGFGSSGDMKRATLPVLILST